MLDTQLNYVSLLGDFCSYCIQFGKHPIAIRPDPAMVIYWMYSRCRRLGNCNSHGAWQASISYLVKKHMLKPEFYFDGFYNICYKTMINLYVRDKIIDRLPIPICWLVNWLKKINVTPKTWKTCDIYVLKKVELSLLTYFSISRPFELTFTDKTIDPLWDVITTGLRWSDIRFIKCMNYSKSYLHLIIHWYKNQKDRNTPKIIDMSPPICNNKNCDCKFLDFVQIFIILKQRCDDNYKKLLAKISKIPLLERSEIQLKRLRNLKVSNENFVFVGKNGGIWPPNKITKIAKEVVMILGIPNPEKFVGYSFKIGAMSTVHKQDLDILKVIRFVAWSVKAFPHVSARYIALEREELQIIPFEMIHGRIRKGKRCINMRDGSLSAQPLWNTEVERLFFEQSK